MVSVEIYIKLGDELKRIDLFKDEKISLTSSVQNINDLSKVFTDYTQSFTIPASKNNNLIFNYWNESGVNDGFDQRIRYDAIIELNSIPFKTGKIQIEKANEKNNRLESYSITFYGKVKQIKDLFKEEKLSILDYTSLNHNYTATEVRNRIDGTTTDGVYYPIIGNQHQYTYGNGGAYDVTIGTSLNTSIVYSDLFPAIPVSKIFEFIGNRYDISFTSTLFDTSYWSELYLYCKNSEQAKIYSERIRVPLTFGTGHNFSQINQTDYTINFPNANTIGLSSSYQLRLNLGITVSDTSVNYRIIVKDLNGIVLNVFDNLIGNYTSFYDSLLIYDGGYNIGFYGYIEVESVAPITFTTNLYVRYGSASISGSFLYGNYTGLFSTILNINLSAHMPDMKVVDFFNGIIKLFNLTITATSETSFNLEPLEFFYSYGKYIDINNFVINDSVDLERTKLYKKLSFAHEKSESILNNYFRNTFNRGYDYGDLLYEDALSNESSTYEIKSPFEDVMWEKTTNENFITATLIDKDLKSYKPKPILMYKNGLTTPIINIIKFFNGTTYDGIFDYQRFSNELFLNNDIASLNFGNEQSSWLMNGYTNNSLFALWYQNYISALYDIRCRIVKLKAIMPITMLSDIKLNDKLIYKDKKYIINSFTTDLTSGEVDLELISDFREVANIGAGRFALKSVFNIDNTAQDLEITILKLNAEKYNIVLGSTLYEDITTDQTFIIPITANTTGDVAFKQIEVQYINPRVSQFINIIQNA